MCRGHNRHMRRDDAQVCINPFHFRVNAREARLRGIFFPSDIERESSRHIMA